MPPTPKSPPVVALETLLRIAGVDDDSSGGARAQPAIAVASHADLCGVIFASHRRPEDEVIAKAAEEGVALFVSGDDTFDVVGRLYQLGVKGTAA